MGWARSANEGGQRAATREGAATVKSGVGESGVSGRGVRGRRLAEGSENGARTVVAHLHEAVDGVLEVVARLREVLDAGQVVHGDQEAREHRESEDPLQPNGL